MLKKFDKLDFISLSEFKPFMTEAVIPITDIRDFDGKPIHKIFQFWRRKELLPFFEPGKWNIHVSFMQHIWIDILLTLRAFSFSIENTKKVCDYFFKDAYFDELPKWNLQQNKKDLEKKKVAGTISLEEIAMLENIEMMLADETLLYVLRFTINYLTQLVYDCIRTSEESGILIFLDGSVVQHVGNYYFSHSPEEYDITKPHIYLSIKHFLKEFIDDKVLNNLIIPQILNDDEKSVLREIKNKNIKELNIKLSNGKVLRIDSSQEEIISGDKAFEIKQLLGLRNYEEVEVSTLDEKSLKFKKTVKKMKSD